MAWVFVYRPPKWLVDYQQTYWLLFLGSGLLLVIGEIPALAAGDLGTGVLLTLLGGTVMSFFAGRALGDLETAGGPERPDFRFGVVLVAFVLILVATVVTLL